MSTHLLMAGLLLLSSVAGSSAYAQDAKGPLAAIAPTDQSPSAAGGLLADRLSKQQREAVQKISQYFNQITALKGTFVQTNADNKRLRGKFYLKRPGLFRFDYAPPSRLVVVSDGKYVAIQDHDLGTDQRWDLEYTAFRMLLHKDVDLLRDARFFEVRDTPDTTTLTLMEKGADEFARISLTFTKAPVVQLKEWTAKDAQGFDTRIVLGDLAKADDLDPQIFNPALTRNSRQ